MTDNPPHRQARTQQGIKFQFWWHCGENTWKWKWSVISIQRLPHMATQATPLRIKASVCWNCCLLTWELKELVKPQTSLEFSLLYMFNRFVRVLLWRITVTSDSKQLSALCSEWVWDELEGSMCSMNTAPKICLLMSNSQCLLERWLWKVCNSLLNGGR